MLHNLINYWSVIFFYSSDPKCILYWDGVWLEHPSELDSLNQREDHSTYFYYHDVVVVILHLMLQLQFSKSF